MACAALQIVWCTGCMCPDMSTRFLDREQMVVFGPAAVWRGAWMCGCRRGSAPGRAVECVWVDNLLCWRRNRSREVASPAVFGTGVRAPWLVNYGARGDAPAAHRSVICTPAIDEARPSTRHHLTRLVATPSSCGLRAAARCTGTRSMRYFKAGSSGVAERAHWQPCAGRVFSNFFRRHPRSAPVSHRPRAAHYANQFLIVRFQTVRDYEHRARCMRDICT